MGTGTASNGANIAGALLLSQIAAGRLAGNGQFADHGEGPANCPIFSILTIVRPIPLSKGSAAPMPSASENADHSQASMGRLWGEFHMSLRTCQLAMLALVVAVQCGCCCPSRRPWPSGPMWYGPQCGDRYWHEWFSIPPECRDRCNCCGFSTARSSNFVRHGGPPMGPPGNWPDAYAPVPTEAEPAYLQEQRGAPLPASQMPEPPPSEELPPLEPSASNSFNEFGQVVSYAEPVESPPSSRTLGNPRRPSVRTW
jgi:hypothetical protein